MAAVQVPACRAVSIHFLLSICNAHHSLDPCGVLEDCLQCYTYLSIDNDFCSTSIRTECRNNRKDQYWLLLTFCALGTFFCSWENLWHRCISGVDTSGTNYVLPL